MGAETANETQGREKETLIERAPSGAAFVNQALAVKLPGLAPSGFNPHAFARSGLRAPLAFDTDEVAR